jgi:septal ring factor EnvC (AmiA/AmiB activator)
VHYDYRMIRLLLALACLFHAVAWAEEPEPVSEQEQQQQLEQVRTRIEALAQAIDDKKSRQGELQRGLEESEKALQQAQARVRKTRAQIDEQRARVAASQDEQHKAEARARAHREALARQVRAAYIIGKQGQAKLLLSQDDSQRLGRVLTYYDYLNRARGQKIHEIALQVDHLVAVAARLTQDQNTLNALRTQQEQELQSLKDSRAQRSDALNKLKRQLADAEEELGTLQQTEKDIQKLLETLKDSLSDIPVDLGDNDKPFPEQKGKLPWPVRGKLLAAYGEPKAGGRMNWNGYWIAAGEGAGIKAVARGRVAYVGWMHRYGLIIVLEHDAGYFSLYGHNQNVAKAVGDWVAAGDVIASAGNSGGYDQTGVYFEVRKGTQPVNPKAWLAK